MNNLKKTLDHIPKFYNKSKKNIKKKIGIVATCLVCVFAPVYSNYTEVKALTGIEETFLVGGVLGILGLCGIGVAEEASESILEFADNTYKGFCSFGETLVGTVKDKWDMLVNGAVTTGTVALEYYNDLTDVLGDYMYDFFNGDSSGGNLPDNFIGALVAGSSIASVADTSVLLEPDLCNSAIPKFSNSISILGLGTVVCFNGILDITYNHNRLNNIYINCDDKFNIYFNDSVYGGTSWTSKARSFKFSTLDDMMLALLGITVSTNSMVRFTDALTDKVLIYSKGEWTLDGLVLDPPQKENPDLVLLDDSYINYGDIADIDLPRYVGSDATVVDGVVNYPGTWAIPNQYNPYLDGYIPVPLPFPLPNVGTVDGTYVGDITTDTPWTDTTDKDITSKPDYIPPTIGDFLGDTDVPGKLNWKEYFPFCIPFDLIKFLGVLAAEPQTPKIKWDYNIIGIKGTLNLDLEYFNGVASVCRTLFNLGFVIGLTLITRNLIKG